MAFGREMNDAVDGILLEEREHIIEFADVAFHENIIGTVFDVFQVGQIAGISEFVEIDDAVVGIFVHKQPNHVRSDESGAARNEDISRE
jgi:hypothetical protein